MAKCTKCGAGGINTIIQQTGVGYGGLTLNQTVIPDSEKIKFSQKCEHHLCKKCWNDIYQRVQQNEKKACHNHNCNQELKKHHFLDETKEDNLYNTDKDHRQKVVDVLNKSSNDFKNIEEYDNYLMLIEQLIDYFNTNDPKYIRMAEKYLEKEKRNLSDIEQRNNKKRQMNSQMKIIQDYEQKKKFDKLNFRRQIDEEIEEQGIASYLRDNNLTEE